MFKEVKKLNFATPLAIGEACNDQGERERERVCVFVCRRGSGLVCLVCLLSLSRTFTLTHALLSPLCLSTAAGVTANVKWPNDVWIGSKKVAGIIVDFNGKDSCVVGVGVNVNEVRSLSLCLSLSLSLSLSASLSLSVCLSVCLSLSLSVSLPVSLDLSRSLSISLALSFSLSESSLCWCVCVCVCVCVCQCVCITINLTSVSLPLLPLLCLLSYPTLIPPHSHSPALPGHEP
jgi:hypothetical protein